MRDRSALTTALSLFAAGSLLAAGGAAAYPDGAPWYAWEGDGCAECHWDNPVMRDSEKLKIEGLPQRIEPGKRYPLTVRFDTAEPDAADLGFLLTVLAGEEVAGELTSESPAIQTQAGQARSRTADSAAEAEAGGRWPVIWQAPESLSGDRIHFILWFNEANGDGSQMGDRIHERTVELCTD